MIRLRVFAGALVDLAGATTTASARRLVGRPLHPDWSLGLEIIAGFLQRDTRRNWPADVPEARRRRAQLSMPCRLADQTRRQARDLGGVPCLQVEPSAGCHHDGLLVYLHGGAYQIGNAAMYDEVITRLTLAFGGRLLFVEYRLAPEHPFPAAPDDALAAWCALLEEGVDPARVILAGDSAGGGLAAALLLDLRQRDLPMPVGACLLSPWVDLDASGGSLVDHGAYDFASVSMVERWTRHYLGDGDRRDPRASPLHADLSGLPPLLVEGGAQEMILDQVRAFADKASAAGVAVTWREHGGMIHDGYLLAGVLPRGRRMIRGVADWAVARLDPAGT